ncbi:MAG TPA: VOC family protein [Vicinamibacterales bacterium]|nr:VOC family protein [Vicinamibacterales bacterium]
MAKEIDRRVDIGHVHLKVSDLARAIAFYQGVLGFELTQRMGDSAAFLSAGGYHHHIGLNTWESAGGSAAPPGTTGLYHFAIRYPDRSALADALRRLEQAGIPLEGAADHGVSEALYLRDPDGNGVELYWDRPTAEWPRAADGSLQMVTERLDLRRLRAEGIAPAEPAVTPSVETTDGDLRRKLRDLRGRLLHLHKVLLDDARASYELDRGRVGSPGNLLQLVISDPWFAWLHALSDLIVRIDETVENEGASLEADGATLIDQVSRLLTASEDGEGFARRYYDALQRQPAVVLAHADVRQILKAIKPS